MKKDSATVVVDMLYDFIDGSLACIGGRGAAEVAGGARRRVRDRGRRGIMRILFMGTPDFAVASLKRLVADGHDVCAVFTQPDKPKNRV